MLTYIIRRLLLTILLLLAISVLTAVIFFKLPSTDPAQLRAGRSASPQLVAQIRHQLGLDKPWYVQWYRYMFGHGRGEKGVVPVGVHGGFPWVHFHKPDFGYSYENDAPVLNQILDRMPATISLTVGAVIVWLLIGIPVGIVSAIRRRTLIDRLAMGGALVAISAPVYWLGLLSLYLFSKDIGKVHLFKGADTYVPLHLSVAPPALHHFGPWFGSLIMPWFVLAATFAAFYARFLRGSLIETMSEDYIRTARAKGLPERTVVLRHGLRSAITPVVTLLGLDIGILLGGAILTEAVFNIPGIGRLVFNSIQRADLPMIQGTVLFGAFFIIAMNLLVDVLYAFLDPRVRY
jgi:peptide/nickel transport system permease protein